MGGTPLAAERCWRLPSGLGPAEIKQRHSFGEDCVYSQELQLLQWQRLDAGGSGLAQRATSFAFLTPSSRLPVLPAPIEKVLGAALELCFWLHWQRQKGEQWIEIGLLAKFLQAQPITPSTNACSCCGSWAGLMLRRRCGNWGWSRRRRKL